MSLGVLAKGAVGIWVASLAGCGASTSLDSPAAGGSSAAGAGGSSVATPAQGASHLALVYSSSTTCPITGSANWSIPSSGTTSSSNVGAQIVDGTNGASVACSVKQSGSGFAVSGSLTTSDNLSFGVGGVTLAPASGSNAFTGTAANVSHYAPNSQTMRGSNCTITVSQAQGAQLAPGKIWADFNCPVFNPSSASSGSCAAQGTFVFGNCAR
jgi:hypothetical protein